MNADLEQLKAEHAEYLQLTQLKDFMAAVNDLLDKKDAELETLRKIAACFQEGDSMWIEYAKKYMFLSGSDPSSVLLDLLDRLQKAAKLAEDGA